MKIQKKNLRFIVVIFLICLLTPIAVFIVFFKNQIISNNIEDWSFFSSYISGFLSTIISLFSLVILSYLTYLVGKQSNEENKKTNILIKKIDAYDELTAYFPQINQALINVKEFPEYYLKRINNENWVFTNPNLQNELLKGLYHHINTFDNFYYLLRFFNVRFGHLFDYDFNSEEFEIILNEAKSINSSLSSVHNAFESGNSKEFLKLENDKIKSFFDNLARFINSIREELN